MSEARASATTARVFRRRVHTSGEVQNPFKIFPAIDVFALLSRDDPYPLACLEVAATETPGLSLTAGC